MKKPHTNEITVTPEEVEAEKKRIREENAAKFRKLPKDGFRSTNGRIKLYGRKTSHYHERD